MEKCECLHHRCLAWQGHSWAEEGLHLPLPPATAAINPRKTSYQLAQVPGLG